MIKIVDNENNLRFDVDTNEIELSSSEIDRLAYKILDVYIAAYKSKDGMCDIE